MDGTARPLTTRDTILLITHAAGDQVAGRTVMQKLAYFAGLGLNTGLGHRAHFYGPYSSRVEHAVSNAVIAGQLHETVERMPHWRGGPDVLKYTTTSPTLAATGSPASSPRTPTAGSASSTRCGRSARCCPSSIRRPCPPRPRPT